MAAFNSMTYRLCKLPLTLSNFIKEANTIKKLAKINGYKESIIDKLIGKHSRRLKFRTITTLINENDDNDTKIRRFSFCGKTSYKLTSIFKKHNIKTVFGNDGKLRNLLGNTKDKLDLNEKSGIYEINCKNCDEKYIGQTKRSIQTRFKEHLKSFENKNGSSSSVAKHMINAKHSFDETNLKLIKYVQNSQHLDVYESIEIRRQKPAMNSDTGPLTSSLLKLCN